MSPCFGQKKRQVNEVVRILSVQPVSIRATALVLGLNRKTIVRKRKFLFCQAKLELEMQKGELRFLMKKPAEHLQMDELETLEGTKLQPVSVPLVVDEASRFIFALDACSMPAKGLLAKRSRKKYGKRRDERRKTIRELLQALTPHVDPLKLRIKTDSSPLYPPVIRTLFRYARHETVLSRRSSMSGQGELKKIGFDPIFSVNHTCAMLRANVARLVRKTWCHSKKIAPLREHLVLYAVAHNRRILAGLRSAQDSAQASARAA